MFGLLVARKLKRFKHRFGIMAPRLVVRSHVPVAWYCLGAALLALLMVGLGWLMARYGDVGISRRQVEDLRLQIARQNDELISLRATVGTRHSAVSIERAAQQQLLSRVRELELENASLKEDMLLFERLLPTVGDSASVRIENFRVVAEGEGRFRYRLLLAYQPDKSAPEFKGSLRMRIQYRRSSGLAELLLPAKADPISEWQLEVKHFVRREGGFVLPADAQLVDVEALILQGDAVKFKKNAQLQP